MGYEKPCLVQDFFHEQYDSMAHKLWIAESLCIQGLVGSDS